MEQEAAAVRDVLTRVQAGWNAGDGEAYAAPFAEDADYVIVDGRHERGRATIAEGHKFIFSTIYKGSHNAYTIEDVRFLRPDVAVAHVHHVLKFNAGGTPQEAQARSTWVLTKNNGEWRIDAFQNTPIRPQGAGSS
jgi:uncharacterized protein (TIGR02246 family)